MQRLSQLCELLDTWLLGPSRRSFLLTSPATSHPPSRRGTLSSKMLATATAPAPSTKVAAPCRSGREGRAGERSDEPTEREDIPADRDTSSGRQGPRRRPGP